MARSARARFRARSKRVSKKRRLVTALAKEEERATRSAHAVLGTYELLEQIISNLDISNILSVKRVCKTFSETIATSTPLQRQLFLVPENYRYDFIFDPLTRRVSHSTTVGSAEYRCHPLSLNPLLYFKDTTYVTDIVRDELHYMARMTFPTHLPSLPAALRDMYLSQPPIKRVRLWLFRTRNGYDAYWETLEEVWIEADTGVTFGMVSDVIDDYTTSMDGMHSLERLKVHLAVGVLTHLPRGNPRSDVSALYSPLLQLGRNNYGDIGESQRFFEGWGPT